MRNRKNVYDSLRNKTSNNVVLYNLLKKEETYWVGATVPAMLFAGFIDGGVSIVFAYIARKLYEKNNGII